MESPHTFFRLTVINYQRYIHLRCSLRYHLNIHSICTKNMKYLHYKKKTNTIQKLHIKRKSNYTIEARHNKTDQIVVPLAYIWLRPRPIMSVGQICKFLSHPKRWNRDSYLLQYKWWPLNIPNQWNNWSVLKEIHFSNFFKFFNNIIKFLIKKYKDWFTYYKKIFHCQIMKNDTKCLPAESTPCSKALKDPMLKKY